MLLVPHEGPWCGPGDAETFHSILGAALLSRGGMMVIQRAGTTWPGSKLSAAP